MVTEIELVLDKLQAVYEKIRELEASNKSIHRAERVDDVIQLGLF